MLSLVILVIEMDILLHDIPILNSKHCYVLKLKNNPDSSL